MSTPVKQVQAMNLRAMLHDGAEIALLDAREELAFSDRHILMASCIPLGRIEIMADDLVPRRSARVVWCDDGDGSAEIAAQRLASYGYTDVSVLTGGIRSWEQAGYPIYSGVHVPSKAFAEVVEHDLETPWITAEVLKEKIDNREDIVVLDSRSFEEYHNNAIPSAISVPGAELVYRLREIVPSPDTMVIVNCGGRTRSIIGAQSLLNAGVTNKVVSLKDGTIAWHLAGYELKKGATHRAPEVAEANKIQARELAERVARRLGIERIDGATLEQWRADSQTRTLYVLDVRTPEEYAAGHVEGIRSAPGGQLVQETDNFLTIWGARVVLADDDGVRSVMTASWLKQMGWNDVAVINLEDVGGNRSTGQHRPAVLGLSRSEVAMVGPAALRDMLESGTAFVADLAYSKNYKRGHIPGAVFAMRSQLADLLRSLQPDQTLVLTSPDGDQACVAAAELIKEGATAVFCLEGGKQAWIAAGWAMETGDNPSTQNAIDVWLPARERGGDPAESMQAYIAWEVELLNQMAVDGDHRFDIARLEGDRR